MAQDLICVNTALKLLEEAGALRSLEYLDVKLKHSPTYIAWREKSLPQDLSCFLQKSPKAQAFQKVDIFSDESSIILIICSTDVSAKYFVEQVFPGQLYLPSMELNTPAKGPCVIVTTNALVKELQSFIWTAVVHYDSDLYSLQALDFTDNWQLSTVHYCCYSADILDCSWEHSMRQLKATLDQAQIPAQLLEAEDTQGKFIPLTAQREMELLQKALATLDLSTYSPATAEAIAHDWAKQEDEIPQDVYLQRSLRAQRQLALAGETDKVRCPPARPWPVAIPRQEAATWSEEEAKQIYNHNYQKLFPKMPPQYYYTSVVKEGQGVLFRAETEMYFVLPPLMKETHLLGVGEATTKKLSQRRAAADILRQMQELQILHVPTHYSYARAKDRPSVRDFETLQPFIPHHPASSSVPHVNDGLSPLGPSNVSTADQLASVQLAQLLMLTGLPPALSSEPLGWGRQEL
eukprot:TRINITY_DN5643_c0_g1_i2.p1 TRINITY_DN5643_c0_g1~~TRINITY_DN5643_c0_g1_i2.p1  ORF type:complete len:463 (+),score=73.73 TRINITY_DN5643_c0_g1_i2:737-2125(+)